MNKKILNLPVVYINKKIVSEEELKSIFYYPEQLGYLWRLTFLDAFFSEDYEKACLLAEGNKVTLLKFMIDSMFHQYSLKDGNYRYMADSIMNYNDGFVLSIQEHNSSLEVETREGVISAHKLTSTIPQSKIMFPKIDTEERIGKCHAYSLKFAQDFGIDCDMMTGYVAPLCVKNRNLHSWIEFDICGDQKVIDFTRGLIFNKEGYYLMKNIEGAVNKINRNTLINDGEIINDMTKVNSYLGKLYFANRDQAIKIYNIMKHLKKMSLKSMGSEE